MKKMSAKKIRYSVKEPEDYEEIVVKPAKRLLGALLETEQKKIPTKTKKTTTSSR